MANVVLLPVRDDPRHEAALKQGVDALIDAFRELHEVERMTGGTKMSARVRLSIMNIMMSVGKLAEEKVPCRSPGRAGHGGRGQVQGGG